MCEMNRDKLLTLFFPEESSIDSKRIRQHVDHCQDCQNILSSLEKTARTLNGWKDELPDAATLDRILERIPASPPIQIREKQPLPVFPLFLIVFFAGTLMALIMLIKDKITLLPIWKNLEPLWIVQQLGTFGLTAFLFILTGILITLLLTPVLILESKHKTYGLKFN